MTTIQIVDDWGKSKPIMVIADQVCHFTTGWRTRVPGTMNPIESNDIGEALSDIENLLLDVYKTQPTIDQHLDSYEDDLLEAIERLRGDAEVSSIDVKMRTPMGTIVATVRRAT